ncbi:MAG: hypothetical protein M1836_002496 [Candelina mexicana]|nr:MAG: hypothetical protein M1836_002496 [Candelina mexicana]
MAQAQKPIHISIIGGGLAGLSLSLALHLHSIPCKVYELRPESSKLGGAVMLSPNALRALDSLGIYPRIRDQGFNFESVSLKNGAGATSERYYFGHEELYGYKALRIYRQVLIEELRAMMRERGIPIEFEKKFSRVVEETSEGVTFEFADGGIEFATLLIGADGIHSKVRHYIHPSITPVYSGQLAITTAIPKSVLRFPPGIDYELPASIAGKAGAFVLAPQDVDGSEILAGTQRVFPEHDRAGWDRMAAAQGELKALFQKDMLDWPDIVQSALENVREGNISIWPYYTVPRLDQWASAGRKVIILGDAAHAIPPTAGQGVNQAFEDTYTFALLLAKVFKNRTEKFEVMLAFWQRFRLGRVDRVLDVTKQMNNKRLPKTEQDKLAKELVWQYETETTGEGGQLGWLYGLRLDDEVEKWGGEGF